MKNIADGVKRRVGSFYWSLLEGFPVRVVRGRGLGRFVKMQRKNNIRPFWLNSMSARTGASRTSAIHISVVSVRLTRNTYSHKQLTTPIKVWVFFRSFT